VIARKNQLYFDKSDQKHFPEGARMLTIPKEANAREQVFLPISHDVARISLF